MTNYLALRFKTVCPSILHLPIGEFGYAFSDEGHRDLDL